MKKILTAILAALAISVIFSCSTQKNTGLTRKVQAFKAKYNTYYNGHQAYIDAYDAQKKGNKDNFLEVLPVYMVGNKATQKLGSGQYDVAVEKSQKTIKQHSITKKPEVSARQRRTAKGKKWLAQKEYNPFLYKAWLLMGNAQFQKGEFLEAASTFAYIQRLFSTKPNIVALARLSEARCYAELEWYYNAENVIETAQRDSFPDKLQGMRSAILADCQVRQKFYDQAIPNLAAAVKKTKGSYEKARLYYLLGQLYQQTGQDQQAYKAFKKVYASNPPYELEFNARIKQSEVLSKRQGKQMIAKLKRMAKNPKNKNYLDQVYYALGNIYLANGDTLNAIYAYKDGVEKSTQNGIPKGVVWLHLGQLYWDREDFVKAQPCYAGALGLFDKEREDYKMVDERSKILDELLPYASAVELQDSLQELARMDSVQRMEVIKKIIEEVKKTEKEEAKKANNALNQAATQNARTTANAQNNLRNQTGQTAANWYFYNSNTVTVGKAEFQKKWGTRELADDWRRKNKTVLANFDNDEMVDSLGTDSIGTDSLGNDSTSAANHELTEEEKEALEKLKEYEADPHRPEYYLKDIPLTEEQMAASNAALVDGLYNSAIIYKDRMENFDLAEKTFQRILLDFPDFEHMDETYYNMFQLYSRIGYSGEAEAYKTRLLSEFPENEHAILVADPMFEYKGRYGKEIEDSLYRESYDAYLNEDYITVIGNAAYTEKEYPLGDNRARFMFLNAMSRLNMGQREQFMTAMKDIVSKYPKSTVSELAGLYVKGLQDGRILANGKMSNGSIWDRKREFLDGDSLMTDTAFSDEKNCNWMFVIAYERDSINENQLLYEMAHYNFSNFSVRNFELVTEKGDGIDMLQIKTFANYDEAYIYFHKLLNNAEMAYKLEGLKMFIISEDNMKKVMKILSFADYFEFYDQVFDRVGKLQLDENLLDEPDVDIQDPDDLYEQQNAKEAEEDYELDDDNFIF